MNRHFYTLTKMIALNYKCRDHGIPFSYFHTRRKGLFCEDCLSEKNYGSEDLNNYFYYDSLEKIYTKIIEVFHVTTCDEHGFNFKYFCLFHIAYHCSECSKEKRCFPYNLVSLTINEKTNHQSNNFNNVSTIMNNSINNPVSKLVAKAKDEKKQVTEPTRPASVTPYQNSLLALPSIPYNGIPMNTSFQNSLKANSSLVMTQIPKTGPSNPFLSFMNLKNAANTNKTTSNPSSTFNSTLEHKDLGIIPNKSTKSTIIQSKNEPVQSNQSNSIINLQKSQPNDEPFQSNQSTIILSHKSPKKDLFQEDSEHTATITPKNNRSKEGLRLPRDYCHVDIYSSSSSEHYANSSFESDEEEYYVFLNGKKLIVFNINYHSYTKVDVIESLPVSKDNFKLKQEHLRDLQIIRRLDYSKPASRYFLQANNKIYSAHFTDEQMMEEFSFSDFIGKGNMSFLFGISSDNKIFGMIEDSKPFVVDLVKKKYDESQLNLEAPFSMSSCIKPSIQYLLKQKENSENEYLVVFLRQIKVGSITLLVYNKGIEELAKLLGKDKYTLIELKEQGEEEGIFFNKKKKEYVNMFCKNLFFYNEKTDLFLVLLFQEECLHFKLNLLEQTFRLEKIRKMKNLELNIDPKDENIDGNMLCENVLFYVNSELTLIRYYYDCNEFEEYFEFL